MKENKAPNIIIPPYHQSAPNLPVFPKPAPAPASPASGMHGGKRVHTDGFDTEMDLPEYNDPVLQKQMEEFEKRVLDVSPNQTIESMVREYEKNYAKSAPQRWQGQKRWMGKENEEMRMVNIMHPHRFIKKLQEGGVNASLYAPGAWNDRIWLNNFSRVGRVGVNAWIWNKSSGRLEARTITTLQYPYGPEWTLMRFNEYDVPTNERFRGWRTALLTLVCANVLSEEEADAAFGPARGQASMFYREQLYYHRNRRLGLSDPFDGLGTATA